MLRVSVPYSGHMSSASSLFSVPPGADVETRSEGPLRDAGLPLLARLEIARELLRALEQATGAGQAHIMGRVVHILRDAIIAAPAPGSSIQRLAAPSLAEALKRESCRIAPDLGAFRERARRLIELIEHVERKGARPEVVTVLLNRN